MDATADLAPRVRARLASRIGIRLALVLVAIAVLRLPAFRWTVISDDEAIYDAMAQTVLSGGVMYKDAVDHKPPGLVYTYAAAERLAGPHASAFQRMAWVHGIGLLAMLITALGLFGLSRRFLGELAWIPPLLYGVASATRCAYDGLAVNGELMMNAPTVLGVWAVLAALHARRGRRFLLDVAAGALIGVAGLYKWQALVTGLAFPFFSSSTERSTFVGRVLRRGPAWLLGLSLPLACTAGFFHARHVLPEAWQWGGLFNLHYISDGPGAAWALQRLGIQLGATVLPSLVLYAAGLAGLAWAVRSWRVRGPGAARVTVHGEGFARWTARGEESARWSPHGEGFARWTPRGADSAFWSAASDESAGLAVWSVAALACVAIGGRFFGHYFLQAELPLSILAAPPLARAASRFPRRIGGALAIPALAFFAFSWQPSVTRALFDPGQPDWTHVGNVLAQSAAPGDTLFVWGNVPPLYPLSQLAMGTRFSFCNYLTGLSPGTPTEYLGAAPTDARGEAWPLLMEDLAQRRPTWVLDTASAGWKGYGPFPTSRYPAFDAYLHAHYRLAASLDGARLLRRADDLSPRPASPPSPPTLPGASASDGSAAGLRTPRPG